MADGLPAAIQDEAFVRYWAQIIFRKHGVPMLATFVSSESFLAMVQIAGASGIV